jgi:hypothetical protein
MANLFTVAAFVNFVTVLKPQTRFNAHFNPTNCFRQFLQDNAVTIAYLKTDRNHFLPGPFKFMILNHTIVRRYITCAVEKASLNNPQLKEL